MNEPPIKKNEKYIVDIVDNGFEGEGIAKIQGFTIFIPNVIKGEKCEILIVKVLTSHAYGKLIEIIEPSKVRKELDCATYQRCGGCDLRHMTYENTLKIKSEAVQSLINKGLRTKIKIESTIGMKNPYNYRNKAQYPVGLDKNGEPAIGVFAQRTHTIVPIEKCMIQSEISQKIAKFIAQFIKDNNIDVYNEEDKTGTIRHIVIKVGKSTNQIMCILVVNEKNIKENTKRLKELDKTNSEINKTEKKDNPNHCIEEKIVKELCCNFPNIKTIVKNINNQDTNVILGPQNINLYGDGYIEDKLGEYIFKISPMSFYQINPVQAEVIYNIAIKAANLNKDDILFDLYCGIGTIGIFASKYVKRVYGIEIVPQAIEDAKENAKINNIKNAEFIVGDVEFAFDELMSHKKVVPTAIIVDPPRKGLDNRTIENIIKAKPDKFVYISCNPATMVRDLAKMENIYDIKSIQLVDMFPFTKHVEVVSVLGRKD